MAVIQVIVSTKYTKEETRQFIDHQNWILNSGTYENDNGLFLNVVNWLFCSTTGLQSFLGTEAYSQLEQVFKNEDVIQSASKLAPVSSALTSWLQEMLIDEPTEQVGVEREKNIRPRYQCHGRYKRSTSYRCIELDAFLRERRGLSEEQFSICFPTISCFGRLSLPQLNGALLTLIDIADPLLLAKVLIGIATEFSNSPNVHRI
eukprot:jgi/Galph1/1570/GphlegSOOS_G261.1